MVAKQNVGNKPKTTDWSALADNGKNGVAFHPTTDKKGLAALEKFFTKRTIFEGMNWIFYGDTGDGKTWEICSAADIVPIVMIIDTEFRGQDTFLLEFPQYADKIRVVEPVVMKMVQDDEGEWTNVIDLATTLRQINRFITALAVQVDAGEIPAGTVVAFESMTDLWQELQYRGKKEQAELAGKTIREIANDGDVEWSEIKQDHQNMVSQLNALRSKGISVIYSCRRNDVDSNSKSREIASEKNLPFHTQNIVKLYTEVISGEKQYFAVFEKMLGKETYDIIENPSFAKLDAFVRDRVKKQLAGEKL